MLRAAFTCLFAVVTVAGAVAEDIKVHSRIDSVLVFPSGAEVTRVAKVKLDSGAQTLVFEDLPAQADTSSIRVEGKASGVLEIGAVDSRRIFISRDDAQAAASTRRRIDDEIEKLKDQRTLIEGQISAYDTQVRLIENLAALPNQPAQPGASALVPREDWSALFALIGTSMNDAQSGRLEANVKIRDLDRRIADLQKELALLAPKREERTEIKVSVAAQTALDAEMIVRYQVRGASWQPSYDARLSTGSKTVEPSLDLVRRATITQRTGEAWEDVSLTLSTTRPKAGSSAPELTPITVDFRVEPKPLPPPSPAPQVMMERRGDAGNRPQEEAVIADSRERMGAVARKVGVQQRLATVENAPFQALYRVSERTSVPDTGEIKRVQLTQNTVAPQLVVKTVPKLDPTAYLYAKFKLPDREALLPGQVSLFRDQTFVGTGRLPLVSGNEEVELGFGTDDLVRVRYAVAGEVQGESGLISSSRNDRREFKISVKNLHERAITLSVLDQLPVSKQQGITVEFIGANKPTRQNLEDKRGIISWDSQIDVDEEKVIDFGYKVAWPSPREIMYGQ
ncbi:conserved hypothetical protein [Filomicrobium insigne]|uniref:Mucoidy inhibitor MuiA family protein n=1 Tax=Filomicrobium insigne TaxID=418854 RepID=A0A1H0LM61_9HYPH|nr:mucoidy inhibitor MuiA family protein [Filomicrobium insigne]SDO69205.1 conserved hypothetical protein [Filomicrobium insigne]